jgi:2-polyprenyl-3-methyl-5-hydroxy-6-metoxy-1,4-benzoquinol methylase
MNFDLLDNAVLPNEFDVVACTNCGFVFNDSSATQDDYDRHYSCNSIYESANLKGLGGSNDNNKFTEIFERISPFLSEKHTIVDVGTAQGGMLRVLKDKGFFHLHGMDLSDANLNALEKQGIIPWRNSICDVRSVDRKFDFVILSHILEHVYDLKTAVCNIKQLLGDNGHAYIEVPNASGYFEYYPEAPFHFFNIEHINHFDLNSLTKLFELHGFETVRRFETDTITDATIKYPVIGIIVRTCQSHTATVCPNVEFTADGCKDNVMAYIRRCVDDTDRINGVFSSIKESGSSVIVWGAGMYAQWLLKNTRLASCDIKYFVDKAANKHGCFVNDIEIKPVDILLWEEFNNPNTAIVITAAVYKFQILNEIKDMKLKCRHYVV